MISILIAVLSRIAEENYGFAICSIIFEIY